LTTVASKFAELGFRIDLKFQKKSLPLLLFWLVVVYDNNTSLTLCERELSLKMESQVVKRWTDDLKYQQRNDGSDTNEDNR